MPKKNDCFKKLCEKCKRPSMPADSSNFGDSATQKKSIHWIVVFVTMCIIGGWVIPVVQRKEDETLAYVPPDLESLRRKLPAIRISGIDFVSDAMRLRNQELMYEMGYVCNERSDDVIFAFQFGPVVTTRRREEHMFALCGKPPRVLGNAELVARGEDEVMCTEEYAGELRQVRRHASVTIKAIDIKAWEVIEYDAADVREACVLQHAIDVLESKWI